jgi:hypothetical protein
MLSEIPGALNARPGTPPQCKTAKYEVKAHNGRQHRVSTCPHLTQAFTRIMENLETTGNQTSDHDSVAHGMIADIADSDYASMIILVIGMAFERSQEHRC